MTLLLLLRQLLLSSALIAALHGASSLQRNSLVVPGGLNVSSVVFVLFVS